MSEEEFKIYVKETLDSIYSKIDNNEKEFISNLVQEFNNSCEINKDLEERIEKAVEYITSYQSIHTIQFGNENIDDFEANEQLDDETLVEMTNRYLKVHDKLLEILEKKEV